MRKKTSNVHASLSNMTRGLNFSLLFVCEQRRQAGGSVHLRRLSSDLDCCRSKEVVMLLLKHCLLLLPLFVGALCFVLILLSTSSFAIVLTGCFTFIVFLVLCNR